MSIINQLTDFSVANDSEKLLLLDGWLSEIANNELPSIEIFENLCALLSQCLATKVDQNFSCFLGNDLLELLTIKLLSLNK